ncbi:GGDEF domain-containing protein [Sphingomonas sp. AP4-R1]|uniref:GGDEF domain-containing protein n=1 Tax=Sphingomonas sp. AP4-R1 TaxID=2735134 RepID=UPI0014932B7D|nr:GGDEF domain-containing protein [Sphingomonas sp. AP4-R1]QJU59685.1 GGDEF domain-containing protein [Sphingomonas sp. AP4-R1]
MGIDAKTILFITLAIALIAGLSLLVESRATRERAQWIWGLGFLTIAAGCGLTPLRNGISFQLGVWVADGLLIAAHILFLMGSARFLRRSMPWRAWLALAAWLPLAAWPADDSQTLAFAVVNAALVAVLALATARMLWRHTDKSDWTSRRLAAIFGLHGLFYLVKAVLVWVPGGFVDIVSLKGIVIQLSLVEGIPVATLLLLVMAASARRRREAHLLSLADSDPLTGLLNRRAFDARAEAMLRGNGAAAMPGALMLCDLDHFKRVNDTCGHAAGDEILLTFASLLRVTLPAGSLVGRYGGDEFVALLPQMDPDSLSRIGATLCARFRTGHRPAGDRVIATTVTIGSAMVRPGATLAALLGEADAAAYEAKRRGRDQMFIRDADMAPQEEAPVRERRCAHA